MIVKTIVVGYMNENCYILEKNNKCIIIDPGDEYEKIVEEIKFEPLCILVTHNHFDHIGAVSKLKNKYNISAYDFNNIKNDKIKIDCFDLNVIYTPGHTDDSVCYYFVDDKIMFTGDFLFKENVGRTDLGGNYNDMLLSLDKIKVYDDDIKIYPGHGEYTMLGYEKKNNLYFRR